MDKLFKAISCDGPVMKDRQLKIWGRSLTVPMSSGKVARFTFTELCGQPLSAADYIELTRAFNTIFLLDVPKMGLNQKDVVRESLKVCMFVVNFVQRQARRFITFIDGEFGGRRSFGDG